MCCLFSQKTSKSEDIIYFDLFTEVVVDENFIGTLGDYSKKRKIRYKKRIVITIEEKKNKDL